MKETMNWQADMSTWFQRLFDRRQWATLLIGAVLLLLLIAPWPLYDKLWVIASSICPQRPSHSLFFGGVQMPIEAREGGIFSGFLIGAVYFLAQGKARVSRLPPAKLLIPLVGFVVLMGLDGLNALAYDLYWPTLYQPNLALRLGTGLLAGLGVAGILLPVFGETVWRQNSGQTSFSSWRSLAGGLGLLAAFWVMGMSGAGLLLYPLSLIAIVGQVSLLVTLVTMLILAVFRRDGRAEKFADLAPWLLVGLVLVLVVAGAAAAVRFSLIGSGPLPALR